jgi:hypothetical protein
MEYAELGLLVVDNGSTDGSVARFRTLLPDIEVIALSSNLGFAGGCNVGIRRACEAGATYVWLVNNDAQVAPGALRALVDTAERDPRVAAAGSLIVRESDLPAQVTAGGWVNRWLGLAGHWHTAWPERRLDYLIGASLLLRIDALDEFQPLDEGFFLYWEDADLCFRLRAQGWRIVVAEGSIVRHDEHGSLRAEDSRFHFHYNASAARFFRRHAAVPIVPIVLGAGARFARQAASGQWRQAIAVIRGTVFGLGLPGVSSR